MAGVDDTKELSKTEQPQSQDQRGQILTLNVRLIQFYQQVLNRDIDYTEEICRDVIPSVFSDRFPQNLRKINDIKWNVGDFFITCSPDAEDNQGYLLEAVIPNNQRVAEQILASCFPLGKFNPKEKSFSPAVGETETKQRKFTGDENIVLIPLSFAEGDFEEEPRPLKPYSSDSLN